MKTNRARLHRWQLARAKEVDESLRERAFLDVPEDINGVVVKQLTLRQLNLLFKLQSPFIYGGEKRIEHVGQFLWVVSPHYSQEVRYVVLPRWKLLWRRFKAWVLRRPFHIPTVREVFVSELVLHPRFENFYRAIDRYIQRTFRDTPASVSDGKIIATSYAAGVVHYMMNAYGGEDEKWLDTPLVRLFQYMKRVQADADPKTPQFNPMQDHVNLRF